MRGRIASPGCSAGGQGDLGNQGPASAVRAPGSHLTATPHSPGWLRRSRHGDLREFQFSLINISSKLKELRDKLQPPFATRLPLQSRHRHPSARFTPLQMSRRRRRPKGPELSGSGPQLHLKDHARLGPGPRIWSPLGTPPAPSLSPRLLRENLALFATETSLMN